jgi:D-alanyl-D-alanine carboxypeptidase/D-alanyl-D-alanine-endopeptidase (penicillin-binding protein 4)
MRAWNRLVAGAAFLCIGLATQAPATAAGAGSLPREVEVQLEAAKVPKDAMVAVVQEVGKRPFRLQWQGKRPVNPASLMKLVTTQTALELLGPAWAWSTPVWIDGAVRDPGPNGTLEGNLVIQGSGDPKLVLERLWFLLRRVQQSGIREIHGDIVLDRSAFAGVARAGAADFDGEPLKPYNVQPDALMLNQRALQLGFTVDLLRKLAVVTMEPRLAGVQVDATVPLSDAPCLDWRSGLKADFTDPARVKLAGDFPASCIEKQWAMAYVDPASYDRRLLAAMWADMNGVLTGTVRDGNAPAKAPSFAITSPLLPDVVRDINKFSNNLMAQQLFLTLGRVQKGTASVEASRDTLAGWAVARLGRDADGLVVDNGSGLSRQGRVTARLLARLLQEGFAGPAMPELMSSLPVVGFDGTLKSAPAAFNGRAHLKSGSLRDVAGVAGYVLSASGKRYVVVGIVNHANAPAARMALDALIEWTAQDGRSRSPWRD